MGEKETPEVQKRDIDSALQRVLAVQSQLMLYDNIATSLDHDYSETLQRQF